MKWMEQNRIEKTKKMQQNFSSWCWKRKIRKSDFHRIKSTKKSRLMKCTDVLFVANKSNLHNKDFEHEQKKWESKRRKNKWLQSTMQCNLLRLQTNAKRMKGRKKEPQRKRDRRRQRESKGESEKEKKNPISTRTKRIKFLHFICKCLHRRKTTRNIIPLEVCGKRRKILWDFLLVDSFVFFFFLLLLCHRCNFKHKSKSIANVFLHFNSHNEINTFTNNALPIGAKKQKVNLIFSISYHL